MLGCLGMSSGWLGRAAADGDGWAPWWSAQHSLHLLPPCGPICSRLPQEGEVAAAARSSKQEGSAVAIGKRRCQQGSEQLDPNAGAVAVQGPEPKSPLGRGKRHRRPTAKAAATSCCEE